MTAPHRACRYSHQSAKRYQLNRNDAIQHLTTGGGYVRRSLCHDPERLRLRFVHRRRTARKRPSECRYFHRESPAVGTTPASTRARCAVVHRPPGYHRNRRLRHARRALTLGTSTATASIPRPLRYTLSSRGGRLDERSAGRLGHIALMFLGHFGTSGHHDEAMTDSQPAGYHSCRTGGTDAGDSKLVRPDTDSPPARTFCDHSSVDLRRATNSERPDER